MDGSFARNLDQTGEHYMIDKSLVKFIVDSAELSETDIVLEIGYGKGALTKEIAKRCKVIAIDIVERELDIPNAVFIHGNILEKFDELHEKYKFNKIVANIPYNISEPLMKILFRKNIELGTVVLTVGLNFGDLLTRKDNRIGIIANHVYFVDLLKVVKPKAFSPEPNTDSAVVRLKPKDDDANMLYTRLVLLDSMKLKNAFEKILFNKTKKQVKEMTSEKVFGKRLYSLTNEEFVELDKILKKRQLYKA